jgi:uncharacterized UPF0160 family protein
MLGCSIIFQQSSRSSIFVASLPCRLHRHSNSAITSYPLSSTPLAVTISAATTTTWTNNEYKRANLDDTVVSTKVIGTHSGIFQADEAMGCWMLQQLAQYRNSKILRTRDPQVLATCDIILDAGGVYDHAQLKYDHHQQEYDERFDTNAYNCVDNDGGSMKTNAKLRCTKLSASGLIYRHYGKDVIRTWYPNLAAANVDLVYTRLFQNMLQALDAIDAGVEMASATVYTDTTGLASRVGRLNPRWNEVIEGPWGQQPPDPDERFKQAIQLCGNDFQAELVKIVESDLPARTLVEQAIQKRHMMDASGEIICLESGRLPWMAYFYKLERRYRVKPLIKFVLYTDGTGMWRVRAVPVKGKPFKSRLFLPEEWRGMRDENLSTVTNIPASRFVHANGFVGGSDTFEGALAMAKEALRRR